VTGRTKRKLSLYFPDAMLRELEEEARRLDRPISWLVEKAWQIARQEMIARGQQGVKLPVKSSAR
jgi:uncharacterized small protein (TIGR04563 family)